MSARPYHYDMPAVRISDSEIVVQKACLKMIATLFPKTRVAAVPNGSRLVTHAARAKAKAEGVSAGFPDLVLVGQKRVQFHPTAVPYVESLVAFVELKASAATSAEQKEWLQFMSDCGHHCGVFRSDKTLEDAMRRWGFQ